MFKKLKGIFKGREEKNSKHRLLEQQLRDTGHATAAGTGGVVLPLEQP